MNKHGGARKGAGRKPKAEEQKLIEKLQDKIGDDKAFDALKNLIAKNDLRAIQLYFNYRFGKPKEDVSISTDFQGIDFKGLFSK